MDLVSWYVEIVFAQAQAATQDGALVTALRNRLVESGPGDRASAPFRIASIQRGAQKSQVRGDAKRATAWEVACLAR